MWRRPTPALVEELLKDARTVDGLYELDVDQGDLRVRTHGREGRGLTAEASMVECRRLVFVDIRRAQYYGPSNLERSLSPYADPETSSGSGAPSGQLGNR